MNTELKRWSLFMPPELMEKTRVLAKKQHISSADVVRKALSAYISAMERAQKQAQEPANVD